MWPITDNYVAMIGLENLHLGRQFLLTIIVVKGATVPQAKNFNLYDHNNYFVVIMQLFFARMKRRVQLETRSTIILVSYF